MTELKRLRNDMGKTITLDASGLLCPLPVLKLRKRLLALQPGDLVTMTATDPAAAIDVPHFCNESGHELVETQSGDTSFTFTIRRK